MKKPQAVNFFIDSLKELDLLTDEQTGKLLKALLRYAENGEEPDFSDDKAIMLMFSMMSRRIDRDFERYSKVCEKRSEVGKKGGAPKGNANAARNPKQVKCTPCQGQIKNRNSDKCNHPDGAYPCTGSVKDGGLFADAPGI